MFFLLCVSLIFSTCLTNVTLQGLSSRYDGSCFTNFTGSTRNATEYRPTRHLNGRPGCLETNINAINHKLFHSNNKFSPRINYHIIIPKLFKILINRHLQGKYDFLFLLMFIAFLEGVYTEETWFK